MPALNFYVSAEVLIVQLFLAVVEKGRSASDPISMPLRSNNVIFVCFPVFRDL